MVWIEEGLDFLVDDASRLDEEVSFEAEEDGVFGVGSGDGVFGFEGLGVFFGFGGLSGLLRRCCGSGCVCCRHRYGCMVLSEGDDRVGR